MNIERLSMRHAFRRGRYCKNKQPCRSSDKALSRTRSGGAKGPFYVVCLNPGCCSLQTYRKIKINVPADPSAGLKNDPSRGLPGSASALPIVQPNDFRRHSGNRKGNKWADGTGVRYEKQRKSRKKGGGKK